MMSDDRRVVRSPKLKWHASRHSQRRTKRGSVGYSEDSGRVARDNEVNIQINFESISHFKIFKDNHGRIE